MTDGLALYRLVMGEDWEGRVRAAVLARNAAAERQRRSLAGLRRERSGQGPGRASGYAAGRPAGRALVRSVVARAAGSRAAVFKRIRNAGCHTGEALWRQLSYVNDKADLCFSSTRSLGQGDQMTAAEKADLISRWQSTWRGTTKLGFTSHMLLSFPEGTDPMAVRGVAIEWCEHFFDSALYGDRWHYVLALHSDRAHPHAHILLNNRGVEQGTWFSCWAGGVMSPQLMREKQAEIAGQYGVALDALTRLERGIFAKAAGLEEIYAAKAEGRRAAEIALTAEERAIAQAAVLGFAKEYRGIGDALDRADRAHLGRLVRRMADEVEAGQGRPTGEGIDRGQGREVAMAEAVTVGEAMDRARVTFDDIMARRGGLSGADRAAFEIGKADLLRDLALMLPDPETRTRYGSLLKEVWPPAVDAGLGREDLAPGARDPGLDAALRTGAAIGLDPEEQAMRIALGGTRNAGLAQDWIDRDTEAVLRTRGLHPTLATEEQTCAAWAALDAFNDRVTEAAFALVESRDLGADKEMVDPVVPGQGSPRAAQVYPGGAPPAGDTAPAAEGDRPPAGSDPSREASSWLATLAASLRDGDRLGRVEAGHRYALEYELRQAVGSDGLLALQKGRTELLAVALPDPADRLAVTRAYVEVLAGERSDPELTRTAASLRSAEARLAARSRSRERSGARDHSRGLDDDMDL